MIALRGRRLMKPPAVAAGRIRIDGRGGSDEIGRRNRIGTLDEVI